jgi:Effector protein
MGHLPHWKYVDFVTKNVPRALRGPFLQPASLPVDKGYSNILVTYYSLPDWLDIFSMDLSRRASAMAHQYQFAIKKYKQRVTDAFSPIAGSPTGRALLDEIAANAGHSVHIIPYWHNVSSTGYFNSMTVPVPDTETLSNLIDGFKSDWPDSFARGTTIPAGPAKGGTGTGKGADVVIFNSPEMSDPRTRGRPSVPGVEPDEVLFHELVHASRQLRGVQTLSPVSGGYDNEEEYMAIIITDLYLSEKGKPLRLGHGGAGRTGHEVTLGRKTYIVYDPGPKNSYLMKEPDKFYENADGVEHVAPQVNAALVQHAKGVFRCTGRPSRW